MRYTLPSHQSSVVTLVFSSYMFYLLLNQEAILETDEGYKAHVVAQVSPRNVSTYVPRMNLNRSALDMWHLKHRTDIEELKSHKKCDIILTGASIVEYWRRKHLKTQKDQKDLFLSRFGDQALTIGIGGDKIFDLVWRLENGIYEALSNCKPRVLVILIGNNNLYARKTQIIGNIEQAMSDYLQLLNKVKGLNSSRIVLQALTPNSMNSKDEVEWEKNPIYENYKKFNEFLEYQANKFHFSFVNCNTNKYLLEENRIVKRLFYDLLHPSLEGYKKIAECLKDVGGVY